MTVNKGLASLADNQPNFSNQALENSVNDIKAVDQDDGYQFIKSQFDVDTAIRLETLNAAQPHLQIGRILTDAVRHTATIIDGSIIPGDPSITSGFNGQGTLLEILGYVQGLQITIPSIYGVPASDKKRGVNDHFGALNNIFLETEDSSEPVFTRLKEIMQLIDNNARTTTALATATAAVRVSNNDLVTFLNSVVADSTDFQITLDNRVNTAAGNMANLNTRVSEIPGDPTTDLVALKDKITDQVSLENSNITGLRTYVESLTNNLSFTSFATDSTLRRLMGRVAQNKQWQDYFENFEKEQENLNPIYTIDTDSDKETLIDDIYTNSGLPDVRDSLDLMSVADKTKRDNRIDTAGFDALTDAQIITKASEQLGITTANRTIYALSESLLNNMNKHDRDEIARRFDANKSANTLS